ncbi:MAG: hypothetical protein ACYDCO_12030 [Armatimonadota bacterium]
MVDLRAPKETLSGKVIDVEWLGKVDVNHVMGRVKVPGGWLVIVKLSYGAYVLSVTFYPDPEHVWDGSAIS